jgi:hypothetical protein
MDKYGQCATTRGRPHQGTGLFQNRLAEPDNSGFINEAVSLPVQQSIIDGFRDGNLPAELTVGELLLVE